MFAYIKPFSSQPNQVQRIHIDRVRTAPAELWDDVRPRPQRSRHGPTPTADQQAPRVTVSKDDCEKMLVFGQVASGVENGLSTFPDSHPMFQVLSVMMTVTMMRMTMDVMT